jgi:hypothetical protein
MTSSCLKGEKSARSHDHERCSPRGYQLSHDLVNWLNRFDPDEFLIEAAKEVTELIGVEAHLAENRRMEPFDVHRLLDCLRTKFIGRTDA